MSGQNLFSPQWREMLINGRNTCGSAWAYLSATVLKSSRMKLSKLIYKVCRIQIESLLLKKTPAEADTELL